jgi:serine protease AprX
LGRAAARAIAVSSLALATMCVGAGTGLAATGYDPAGDPNSADATTAYLGAQAWWDGGYTGAGIDVAVIDSGVSPVQGLSAPNKVIYGPDLSFDSQAPNLRNFDTYGHGTFMAGLIAGRDDGATAPYSDDAASVYRGVAPDARIVSLKVATANGATDVSQVIAAIDWVVQHAHDPGLNIRVLNLSYGTNSRQASGADPLAYAVEQAWKRGIVVVAAAGNTGYQRGNGAAGLADPAYNPFVIAAGGSDSMGTAATNDDRVGSYSASSSGCGSCKNPDFVAPGSHLQGLRVVNSWLDANHPEGQLSTRYFRGSGTSEAAAVVSGAVALVLQKYPTMSPDLVKRYFATNAAKLSSFDTQAQGAGQIRLGSMLGVAPPWSYKGQNFAAASGSGTLEGSRGQDHLSRDGIVLSGEQDIFGEAFDSAAMARLEASASSWSGEVWNSNTWSSNTWSGSDWSSNTWSSNTWSSNTWSSNTWSSNTWSSNTWSSNTWSGGSWADASWN